ncbi:CD48 antigen-like isoform X1 [Salminus brasiliensis]|uniref:CD48 antigen-like isoform X1 n=1 Tax=Salminus brasiliensis TaxID=930266 RepID=UPI003B833D26
MAVKLLLMFSVSAFFSFTGSSNVFVQVGKSFQMDIQDKVLAFDDLSWIHNNRNVIKYYPETKYIRENSHYKQRVEFNKETYSLTLKNLQKSDGGKYVAKASGGEDTIVAEYTLSVLDPVEAPVLTQHSSGTCNITLTCGYDGLSIHSSSIICNHSNPFSWKRAVMQMETFGQLCPSEDAASAGVSVCLLKTGLYSIILILMLSAVITVHVREILIKSS